MDLNKILAILGTGIVGFIAIVLGRYQAGQKKIVRLEEKNADEQTIKNVHDLSDDELDALLGDKRSPKD